jgi:hypothetical protein
MTKFSDLIAYFENIARTHVDIQHSDNEKHFFRIEIDEVLAGINRTDVNYPMLILEGYSFDFTDNRSDNLLKNRQGAFVLLGHVADISDYDAIHEQWELMEDIGTDILIKIRADKRDNNVPVVRDFNFASVSASLLMNEIGNGVGIRFRYTIASPTDTDIDISKWMDLNPSSE